ncbi:hydrogenase maturation nickel metallochaperone HypA [Corynebacterium sp. 13CS0277]|uniref:hydrogenase maturation nickel metallochaperone HypA/HybF n=1 Tax=Corynebacterium sp. 13CS0277 TaxID=2071994 RepID=UPI001E5025E8|nr:hydrogenase maturation nickel metallochaperone HypA [Corynebacterium sp. 13CS0277]
MHEVALSRQLAQAVTRAAGSRHVVRVDVRIGALRQVVPRSLEYAWTFTTHGTTLDGAELHVEWVPARVACQCGFEGTISGEFSALCPQCGAVARILAGEEFSLVSIDVDADPAPPPPAT